MNQRQTYTRGYCQALANILQQNDHYNIVRAFVVRAAKQANISLAVAQESEAGGEVLEVLKQAGIE